MKSEPANSPNEPQRQEELSLLDSDPGLVKSAFNVKRELTRICAAKYCHATKPLFSWPNPAEHPKEFNAWTDWWSQDMDGAKHAGDARLCWMHFEKHCFQNLVQYVSGFDTE